MTIYFSNVTFQNLNLLGSLAFDKCNVTIFNSQISPNQNETEQVILADNETTFIAHNLTIDSKEIKSIVVNNHSLSSLTNCSITNFQIATQVKNASKVFFFNCTVQNNIKITNSLFLEALYTSYIQAIDTDFQQCTNDGIQISDVSFLNISHCSFSKFDQSLTYVLTNSKGFIHNCVFHITNDKWNLLSFDQSKCTCSDWHFDSIYRNAVQIENKSQLSLE
jgi:hypothetical protein